MDDSYWPALIATLEKHDISKDDVNSLRAFIEAPDVPIGLLAVTSNLLRILPRVEEIISLSHLGVELSAVIRQVKRVCTAIERQNGIWPATISKGFSVASDLRGPLYNYYSKHLLYAALYHADGRQDQLRYDHLFAHALLAIKILRSKADEKHDEKVYTCRINNVLLLLRKSGNIDSLLAGLPHPPLTHHTLWEALAASSEQTIAHDLRILLNYSLGFSKGIVHTVTTRRTTQRAPSFTETEIQQPNLDPEQEKSEQHLTKRIFTTPSVVPDKRQQKRKPEHLYQGCSPGEFTKRAEFIEEAQTGGHQKRDRTAAQRALKAKSVKTHIAMQHQRFPHRWDRLTIYEVVTLLKGIDELSRNGEKSFSYANHISDLELAAVLTAMFWFSCPLELLQNPRLYDPITCTTATESGFVMMGSHSCGYWLNLPAEPILKLSPSERQRTHAVKKYRVVLLNTGLHVERVLTDYLYKGRKHPEKKIYLFKRGVNTYRAVVTRYIAELNKNHRTRLTPNRISDYIFDQISIHEGSDLTIAMLATGREHFLGQHPLHYTAITTRRLGEIFRQTCKSLSESMALEGWSIPDNCCNANNPPAEGHVGSNYRPLPETVSNLIDILKRKLHDSSRLPEGPSRMVRIHNNITRYTLLMLGFATGFRAVNNPISSTSQIDLESGFLCISDKDNTDNYNARIVWLPPVCIEQLRFYLDHLRRLVGYLQYLQPSLYDEIRRQQGFSTPQSVPLFFYLRRNKEWYEMRPKYFLYGLTSAFSLPVNSNRHFLRSNLIESGCAPEVVAAFMGHWERGEEPWGRYSAFSPVAYKAELGVFLEKMLGADGWEAIPGLR